MTKAQKVKNAETLAIWLRKDMIRKYGPYYISCRAKKVSDGGGCFHWAHRYLLECDEERQIDIDTFCRLEGIKPFENPYFTYGLRKVRKDLYIEQHGDTLVIA